MLAGLSLSSVAQDYQQWPVPAQLDNEMCYSPKSTHFSVWSPMAKSASVYIYKNDEAGCKPKVVKLRKMSDGTWQADVKGNWHGYYYDFRVMQQGDKEERLHSPGIFVKMVGTNGKRGYVADMSETNPEGWESDKRPPMKSLSSRFLYGYGVGNEEQRQVPRPYGGEYRYERQPRVRTLASEGTGRYTHSDSAVVRLRLG